MELIQQLVNGISLGSIYALIALGYTMVYGIVKLINFAHGDVFMVGSFVGFYSITVLDLSFIPALLISMIVCAIFGVLIERIADEVQLKNWLIRLSHCKRLDRPKQIQLPMGNGLAIT